MSRLKTITVEEGKEYTVTDYARYKSGRKNYKKRIPIRRDNKWIHFVWDTGEFIMRLDKYLELPGTKRSLLTDIK